MYILHTESGIKELQHVLLLLLGCAIQCEEKERYINAIKGLDIDTQTAIVVHIKQVSLNFYVSEVAFTLSEAESDTTNEG